MERMSDEQAKEMIKGALLDLPHSGYVDTALDVYSVVLKLWLERDERIIAGDTAGAYRLLDIMIEAIEEVKQDYRRIRTTLE